MSDYTKTTNFTAKDNLSTNDPLKVIKGSYFDTEYDAIVTAIGTKYDTTNLASQAEAQAGTNNIALMTPLRAEEHMTTWAAENDSMITDIHALNLAADALLGWDQSGTAVIGFTLSDGLEFNGTTIRFKSSVAGNGLAESSGVLSVGADQGLEISGDKVTIADQSVSTTVPIKLTAGALGWDSASIAEIKGAVIDQAVDNYLLDDNGVLKAVPIDTWGIKVVLADANQTLGFAQANTMQVLTGSTNRTYTIPANATTAFEIGTIIICQNSGTGDLKILGAANVIIDSVFHAAAATAQSDVVRDGGSSVLVKTATDTWSLSGDIRNS